LITFTVFQKEENTQVANEEVEIWSCQLSLKLFPSRKRIQGWVLREMRNLRKSLPPFGHFLQGRIDVSKLFGSTIFVAIAVFPTQFDRWQE
jgi:hypothetical protein